MVNYADALRSSTSTPTSTSPSHNMLKYPHAESLYIRNRLAYTLRGAYCRAIGGYVVENSGSRNDCTAEIVSNHINGVNQIFSQVCMRFAIHSISYTNDPYLANVHITNTVQWLALTALEQNTGMLELYFVPSLSGGATAFHVSKGIVVGPRTKRKKLRKNVF